MNTIKGDLIKYAQDGQFDVIVHGCNCFHTMGAGIAKQIKIKFPEAYAVDRTTNYGDKNKLGSLSSVDVKVKNDHIVTNVNGYTQWKYWSKNAQNLDYNALRLVFRKIKKDFPKKKIGFPRIGAGLCGGNWNRISKIIDEELNGADYTLVEFE